LVLLLEKKRLPKSFKPPNESLPAIITLSITVCAKVVAGFG